MRTVLSPDADHTESPVTGATPGVDQVTLSSDDIVWCAECTRKYTLEHPDGGRGTTEKTHRVSELHFFNRASYSLGGAFEEWLVCPLTGCAICRTGRATP